MKRPPAMHVMLDVAGTRDEIARLSPEDSLLFEGDYRGDVVAEDIAQFTDIVMQNWPWFARGKVCIACQDEEHEYCSNDTAACVCVFCREG